ncbi:MAG TPA: hypothetical protein EYQ20_22120 [candidate division Zixibacteria bacterium]|jgi:gamma-glutamyltranspeptidase|nr:hypothetical protein [candidate division Zixibacteria bacterium]
MNAFHSKHELTIGLASVMALGDGKPWLAFGAPGGDGQTQTNVQILNNIRVFGMTPQEARTGSAGHSDVGCSEPSTRNIENWNRG